MHKAVKAEPLGMWFDQLESCGLDDGPESIAEARERLHDRLGVLAYSELTALMRIGAPGVTQIRLRAEEDGSELCMFQKRLMIDNQQELDDRIAYGMLHGGTFSSYPDPNDEFSK